MTSVIVKTDDVVSQCILPVVYPHSFSLQLPKDQCTESFEKSILRLLNQGDQSESRDVEKNLRYFTFSPDIHLICLIMGILQD